MDSSNIVNHSKASAFNKVKHLFYIYYPSFLKISKIGEHLNQFVMLLYDCVPSLSQFLSIEEILNLICFTIRNG